MPVFEYLGGKSRADIASWAGCCVRVHGELFWDSIRPASTAISRRADHETVTLELRGFSNGLKKHLHGRLECGYLFVAAGTWAFGRFDGGF